MTGLCSKFQTNSLTGISKQRHHIENRMELFILSGTHTKIFLQFTTRWYASTDASRALDAKVSTAKIFGPAVCIYSYDKREKAIEIANSLDVHFQAAVFTKNIDIALDCVKKLNATAVMVNDHTALRVDWMPFGGRDTSGIGMGGIQYSMHEMTREKLMVIKSKSL